MKAIFGWIKGHPTQAVAIATIVLGWFSFILPPAVIGGIGSIIGILLGVGVHSMVTPVATAAEKITEAATTAATEVTKQLSSDTVGAVNNVTKAGESVINNVVDGVLGKIQFPGRVPYRSNT